MRWQPTALVNGSPVLFRVVPPVRLDSLCGTWLGHDVFFSFDAATRTWYGFAGVSLETTRGSYTLQLEGMSRTGQEVSFRREIGVGVAKYQTVKVKVAREFTEPNAAQLQRIREEQVLKGNLLDRIQPQREWSGKFVPPVAARVSDLFGTRRTFNGKLQSTHQGLDYAVPEGTPVAALNAGAVLLARPLFFEGNCVVIDHGQGLLTLYMHFSQVKVKEGEAVTRGQILGLSGGTGRATGPHLHVAVRWQGVYLNPATLVRLRLP